ncbi:shikimate kinase [Methanocella sp. CWC-04]|uniref:Shikimate kinase n=1 Tax=Methanooceanicella nereidis TaxID=2052831 RepID=A0AAP2REN5_9EURY|nr:shikimate kinase [Methanocella sp. CWC-04]MCD1294670.1 shikimate kinase [Methanocella sp. CWC-04]
MEGHAIAFGAGTVINAIANWKGSAFGIELKTEATVEIKGDLIEGEIAGGGDTRLIERACEIVLEKFDIDSGAKIVTSSEVPLASGLKSSSAAANATVLATLRAIRRDMDPLEAVKLGVRAALDTGVSITGAFDDACASMFGGVVMTDNREMELLKREEINSDVVIYVPDKKAFSADTDIRRSRLIAPWVGIAFDLALEGYYRKAMTLNGLLYSQALGFDSGPVFDALELGIKGVSLSGTGPSIVALTSGEETDRLRSAWSAYPGSIIVTAVNNKGAFTFE